jgi:hypothetical protein
VNERTEADFSLRFPLATFGHRKVKKWSLISEIKVSLKIEDDLQEDKI